MAIDKYTTSLKKYCLRVGADIVGIADVRSLRDTFTFLPQTARGFDRAVCLGVRLSQGVLMDISRAPTRLYFHHYRVVNTFLDQLALRVASSIERKGYRAIPIAASQIVDWQKQTGHLSHKRIGFLAGLGWLGRNNLLVNRQLGSQFRMATVVTDMPLKAATLHDESCGACHRCVEVCPADAIGERPEEFDHTRCFAQLKEFQRQHLVDQYVCGVCVRICSGGRK